LGDGIEGMVHIGDITNENRLDHPREKLAKDQVVKAVVLELDRERHRIRLGIKQLEPTTIDHYISDHRLGETVSGRVVEVRGSEAKIELGEGVIATCRLKDRGETQAGEALTKPTDVSSVGALIQVSASSENIAAFNLGQSADLYEAITILQSFKDPGPHPPK
jgi:small subunit ribosomal protein S1